MDLPVPTLVRSQVRPHDDLQVLPPGHVLLEQRRVLEGLLRGVDRTRPDDDEYSIVRACEDPRGGEPGGGDGLFGLCRRDYFVSQQRWLDEGVVLKHR